MPAWPPRAGTTSASYWVQTRRPLPSLVFVLPLLMAYELGVVWLGGDSASGLRTGADAWMRQVLAGVGLTDRWLPPLALAGFGLGVGAVALVVASATGLIDYATSRESVEIAGLATAWWVPIAELAVIAAALAYAVGVMGTRLVGATIASFVGLSEVLFAIVVAWVLLGELPGWIQLAGGLLILAGVVAVRLGEATDEDATEDGDDRDDGHDGGRPAYRPVGNGSAESGESGRQADWPAPHPVA